MERHGLMVCVEKNEEGVAYDTPAVLIRFLDLVSHQAHTQALDMSRAPVGIRHFRPSGSKPIEIFHLKAMNRASLEKVPPPKDRILTTQPDELAGESEQFTLIFESSQLTHNSGES